MVDMFVCVCVYFWNVMNLLLLNDSLYGSDFTCQIQNSECATVANNFQWHAIRAATSSFSVALLVFSWAEWKCMEPSHHSKQSSLHFTDWPFRHTHKITSSLEDDFKREFVELMMIYPAICVCKILGWARTFFKHPISLFLLFHFIRCYWGAKCI